MIPTALPSWRGDRKARGTQSGPRRAKSIPNLRPQELSSRTNKPDEPAGVRSVLRVRTARPIACSPHALPPSGHQGWADLPAPQSTPSLAEAGQRVVGIFLARRTWSPVSPNPGHAARRAFSPRAVLAAALQQSRPAPCPTRLGVTTHTARLPGQVWAPSELSGCAPPASQEVVHQALARGPELRLQTPGRSGSCQHVGCRYPSWKQPRGANVPRMVLARLWWEATFHLWGSVRLCVRASG